ncbi:hypothetical protein HJB88_27175 [Rhizobium sp. NZLR5]|uniref:hypothetical protein n=1 Tax=Rhizobium sp. NZLR5 TaxID=2731103 RepID=UPI001C829487|nr:hypothetical protein [Rhizobium sp. NZLR5]MBX5186267.1 hypothetical protein [Rhizobium sp. NZLR5]
MFGTKRFPVTYTDPSSNWVSLNAVGVAGDRIFALGGASSTRISNSNNSGPWGLSITLDGSNPWVTQFPEDAPFTYLGSCLTAQGPEIIDFAFDQKTPSPTYVRRRQLLLQNGSLANTITLPFPTNEYLTGVGPTPDGDLLIGTQTALYRMDTNSIQLIWTVPYISLPAGFPPVDYVEPFIGDWRYDNNKNIVVAMHTAVKPRGDRYRIGFASILCINPTGDVVWGPTSHGDPTLSWTSMTLGLGADLRAYWVTMQCPPNSEEGCVQVMLSYNSDGTENHHGWPRRIDNAVYTQLSTDSEYVYASGGLGQYGGSTASFPTVASYDYSGNESTIYLTQYAEENELWRGNGVIAADEVFFHLGFASVKGIDDACLIRKYDKYGLQQ